MPFARREPSCTRATSRGRSQDTAQREESASPRGWSSSIFEEALKERHIWRPRHNFFPKPGRCILFLAGSYYWASSCIAPMPLARAAGLLAAPLTPRSRGTPYVGTRRKRLIDRFALPTCLRSESQISSSHLEKGQSGGSSRTCSKEEGLLRAVELPQSSGDQAGHNCRYAHQSVVDAQR